MHIHKQVTQPIDSQEMLYNALLSRIPENHRETFFTVPSPDSLSSELHGLDPAALDAARDRLLVAIKNQEKVLIFGDYDCDGVTATAVLWETLHELGLTARPFLPHREKHGYGLSVHALEEIWSEYQPDLVVTVDNGIVAHDAFSWLKQKGVDTLLTDHHTSDGTIPAADIVLHSTQLAGVSVAWMLVHSLNEAIAATKLDYVVLGTLADQVPLHGANRSFAVYGLKALRTTPRQSLQTLAKMANIHLADASPETVHFTLAPRINAMGRLGDAMDALRALVSKNPDRTQQLMHALQKTNSSRQVLTKELYEDVIEEVKRTHEKEHILVVAGEFHEGIIGLLASKLVETFYKPAIVLSVNDSVAKASVRSIRGWNSIEFLRSLEKTIPFLALGGHAMAAGFSIPTESLETSTTFIRESARTALPKEMLTPRIDVIGSLDWSLLTAESLQTIQKFAPFGAANENPLFLIEDIDLRDYKPVGKDGSHWVLTFGNASTGFATSGIYFKAAEKMSSNLSDYHAVVLEIAPSNYRGKEFELIIRAVLPN